MRYTYTGKPVKWFVPVAFAEGQDDERFFARHDKTNLYTERSALWKRIAWRLGFMLSRALRSTTRGKGA